MAETTDKIINPFKPQDIPFAELPVSENSRFGSDVINNMKEMQVGAGTLSFNANESGIWLGAKLFKDAPFRVSMAGVMTLSQTIGTKNFTSTPTTPYVVGDLWTQGSGGAIKVCITSRATGAYVAGDWDLASNYQNSGQVTTIIGNTVTTGYVNALGITAGSISANNIQAGTITGSTLQTASSGQRIIIDGSNNDIRFYDSNGTYQGRMVGSTSGSGSIFISGVNTVSLAIGSTNYIYASGASAEVILAKDMLPVGTVRLGDLGSEFSYVWTDHLVVGQVTGLNGTITFNNSITASNLSGTNTGNETTTSIASILQSLGGDTGLTLNVRRVSGGLDSGWYGISVNYGLIVSVTVN